MADVVFWWWFAATFSEMPPVGLVAGAPVCAFYCHGDEREGGPQETAPWIQPPSPELL